MKKALIVDWLDQYGGSERVIKVLDKICSFDVAYTLINLMDREDLKNIFPKESIKIAETPLKIAGKRFRFFFFTFHFFAQRIKIDKDVDLIFSSSHSVGKGVKKSSPHQLHISYFQARNFNYIWNDYALFFGWFRFFFLPFAMILRKIDVNQSARPDYIISNSIFVKDWVKKTYKRESVVIYPPVELSNFPLKKEKEDYFVVVGRLASVKRFDIAIKAFNQLNCKLIVIGDGEHFLRLKKIAGQNIVFKGFLDAPQVSHYIQNARAYIQTGVEGFGIASIEAQACGTPVIAYGEGGVLETVISDKTGVFFKKQTVESLVDAIDRFNHLTFDPVEVRNNALRFSTERFEQEISAFVSEKVKLHNLS